MRNQLKSSQPTRARIAVAIALLFASIAISATFSILSQRGERFYVATKALLPGSEITGSDIELRRFSLGAISSAYFSEADSPELFTSQGYFSPGELIARSKVSDEIESDRTVLAPLAIRSVDIPESAEVGDLVSLFWVLDTKNEELFEPELIAQGIYVKSIDRRGSNFGSDLAVTVSISQSQVARLLSYTSGGRIVVVPSHG